MTNISELIPHIEALIFASDKPLTSAEVTDLMNQSFSFMDEKIASEQIDAALDGIVEKYQAEFYPFEVKQSGGGWQFLTKKTYHKTVAQLNGEKFLKRLSTAALETLAIIAYKQPVTKGEVEAIRGVSSDYAVQKLLEKELIIIAGRNEKLPGHPLIYSTSKSFMDYFGINSADDLPKIREILAEQVILPTQVNQLEFEQGELAVTEAGEIVEAGEEREEEREGERVEETEELGDDGMEEDDRVVEENENGEEEEIAVESDAGPETELDGNEEDEEATDEVDEEADGEEQNGQNDREEQNEDNEGDDGPEEK